MMKGHSAVSSSSRVTCHSATRCSEHLHARPLSLLELLARRLPLAAITIVRGNQRPSEAITIVRGNQRPSEAISGL